MDGIQIRALIHGYINSSNDAKQRLGRCFAVELGLEAGPRGSDGGVDGEAPLLLTAEKFTFSLD